MTVLKNRSVFLRVILVNTGLSFLLFVVFLLNFIYFDAAVRREQAQSAGRVLGTIAERFHSESIRLAALMDLCATDPTFVLAVSNRLPASRSALLSREASEKLLLMLDSMPYARNVFAYLRNSDGMIFPNLVIGRKLLFHTENQAMLPGELAAVDFGSLGDGFQLIGGTHLFVSTFRDYGAFITVLDTARFAGVAQFSSFVPNVDVAIFDAEGRLFAVGEDSTSGLLATLHLTPRSAGTVRSGGQAYRVDARALDGGFRALLVTRASPALRLEYNNSLVAVGFSLVLLVVCLVLVLVNTRIYLPLRRIVDRYRGASTGDEIELISGTISALSAENLQMHRRIDERLGIQSEIELSLAVHAGTPLSPDLAASLAERWKAYRVLVVATQDDAGGGEDSLAGIDDLVAESWECRVIQVDPFSHAYLLLGETDVEEVRETLSRCAPVLGSGRILFAGLSNSTADSAAVPAAWRQARGRLLACVPPGAGTFAAAWSGDGEEASSSISLELLNTIARCALNGDQRELQELVGRALSGDERLALGSMINAYRQVANLILMLATPANSVMEPRRLRSQAIPAIYNPSWMGRVLAEDFSTLADARNKGGVAVRYDIVEYLHRHYSEPLSLDSIAAAFRISPVYLSSWFRKKTGVNLSVYLATLRIEEAKRILAADRQVKIADVARQVGIPGAGSFIRLFKRYAGCTPDRYRQAESRSGTDAAGPRA